MNAVNLRSRAPGLAGARIGGMVAATSAENMSSMPWAGASESPLFGSEVMVLLQPGHDRVQPVPLPPVVLQTERKRTL